MTSSIQQGFQYTGPMTSSPNIGFQSPQFSPYPTFTQGIVNPQTTPGIEALLKEMCMRMERVETKLSSLDKIEARLNKIDYV